VQNLGNDPAASDLLDTRISATSNSERKQFGPLITSLYKLKTINAQLQTQKMQQANSLMHVISRQRPMYMYNKFKACSCITKEYYSTEKFPFHSSIKQYRTGHLHHLSECFKNDDQQ